MTDLTQIWVYPNPDDHSIKSPRWLLWAIGHLYYAYTGEQPNTEPRNCIAHGRTPEQARDRAYARLAQLDATPDTPVLTGRYRRRV